MIHINTSNIDQTEDTAVTIGNFDGLHLGHRALIYRTMAEAAIEGLRSIVLTFSPHPMFLFHNKDIPALILTEEEKLFAIEETGVDIYIEYPFDTEFLKTSPEDFANMVFDRLRCKVLVVGDNYTFGYKGAGDAKLLKKLGAERGVRVIIMPIVEFDGDRVSSSRIRSYLVERNMEAANRLLSKPYFIYGEVIQGKKLGRTIGFPTVNIRADTVKLFPPNGVYASRTLYNGKLYYGVTNVGFNPTVNGEFKVVETFIFDFHEMVYGEKVKVYFYKGLRPEQKFDSVGELVVQMTRDAEKAKEYFDSPEFNYWRERY
ncbi:MAG: bifunctional riboflavin kinase/FAD synthetase [Firmicutes bacterium]|nr:bifunctional riboflavin kinase/FAD synthetase [Bacillota bacterium]